jgi:hypothetical protein
VAACDACFGSGACTTDLGCNGVARPGTPGAAAFRYFAGPGEIVGGFCFPIGRWAP